MIMKSSLMKGKKMGSGSTSRLGLVGSSILSCYQNQYHDSSNIAFQYNKQQNSSLLLSSSSNGLLVKANHPSSNLRRNFSTSSAATNRQSTIIPTDNSSSSSSTNNDGKSRMTAFVLLRNFLIKALKIYGKIVLTLIALSLSMYGGLRGFLAIIHFTQFDNPSSPYYNKELADKLAGLVQICEGLNRYIKSLMTIYAIAIDYFWLLITEPYNPRYWFVEKPDKNSEEFVQQKKQAHKRNAERLLNLFIEQRGVYIKIGQFLSSLVSAIPDEYIDTLKVLRDRAPTIPFDDVRKVIHQDFGKSIEELFDEFEEKPIAAASIAQVHRARTKDGRLVAVKVQYPFVRSYFEGDMRTNDSMSTLSLKLYYMQEDADNIDTLVEMNNKFNTELENGLYSELDFRHEASNARQAAEHMKDRPDVYVPKIYDDLTSERVLTMEFIENACTANNVEFIKNMGFTEEDIAERILSAFSDQLFVHGFIQADPHSSNVFVRRNPSKPSEPQLVLLDHGLYKKFDEDFRIGYAKFVNSIVLGDEKGMRDYCESLGITDYKMYASMMMMQAFDQLEGGEDYSGKNFEEFNEVMKEQFEGILDIYKKMPADMLFISRADNILRGLNKDLGAKVNRFTVMARSAARGMNINSKRSASNGLFDQMNEWKRRMYFEFRLYILAIHSWFIMFYMKIFGMNAETIKLKKEHDKIEMLEKEVELLETPKHITSEYK